MVTPITSQIYFSESSELGHNEICCTVGSSEFESASSSLVYTYGLDVLSRSEISIVCALT